jgi:phage gpG-like protein
VIDFKVSGDGQVLAGMVKAEADTLARVGASILRLTLSLKRKVKEDKLSGQVLKVRTGTLRRSIGHDVFDDGAGIVGAVSTPIKYAPPHEFGATIPARIVEAKRAGALRFQIGGKFVFAKRVNIPSFKLPERSFMRSALADMDAEIRTDLQQAADGPGVNL